ncbi:MAG: S46 family peptidase [Nannocystaceae bacterium]
MASAFDLVSAGALTCALTCALAPDARADEGQWMPEQIAELDHEELGRRGLERTATELWDPAGGGLLRAAVNLSGCSASFVSPEGLVITNHHCAYSALQARSTVDRDLLKDGFLARTRAEEEPAPGKTIRVVARIDDVTAELRAAADAASDDAARLKAVRAKTRALVKECDEEAPGRRCEVASFFGGSQYRRFAYQELRDVRLVYAPPSSIGEFGGEVDNWMWPRHTGDFAILRAYVAPDGASREHHVDNVPYRPEHWLKVSAQGVRPGDFVAVLGYPGHTTRYLWAEALAARIEVSLPQTIDLYGEWIAIAEELGAADPAVAIKVASTKKSLANRHKNSRGMLAGIEAMGLLERRRAEERRLAEADREGVLRELAAIAVAQRVRSQAGFLRAQAAGGPTLLDAAVDLVRWARERERPDAERAPGYLDRDRDVLWRSIERRLRDHDDELAAQLLAAVLRRAAELAPEQRIAALEGLIAGKTGGREVFVPAARRLFAATGLTDAARLRALFDADAATLRAAKDPLLRLANALADEVEAAEAVSEREGGRLLVLNPAYFELLRAVRPGPLYPDANGTLRMSYASVRGYRPRDGLEALPQTTLAGQLAKVTGAPPFELPERVLAKVDGAAGTIWADAALEDLVLCFLSDADTTGGNSGSAVINGRGEVVGLNFDRVWENIAGDVAYQPSRSRNIVVELRYLFWLLDQVEDATALLDELGVGELRGKERPTPRGDAAERVAGQVTTIEREDGGDAASGRSVSARAACACVSAGGRGGPSQLALVALVAALLGRRRRRA